MLLDGKLKQVALLAAVDICLRRVNNSPKRCARNLVELGTSAYPGKISKAQSAEIYAEFLNLFENGDIPAVKALFSKVFL